MRIVVFIILICCIAGCRDKHELPSGILKSEKMQAVLWDVILAESYTSQFIKKDSLKDDSLENARLQQQIFAIHKISSKEFYDSYNYYSSHAELMNALLDSMTTKGEKEREKLIYSKPVKSTRISLMASPEFIPKQIKIIPMPIPTLIPVQDSTSIQNSSPVHKLTPMQETMLKRAQGTIQLHNKDSSR